MRAAATGSTEPEGLRKLSGVAHHYRDVTEMVDFAASLDFTNRFCSYIVLAMISSLLLL